MTTRIHLHNSNVAVECIAKSAVRPGRNIPPASHLNRRDADIVSESNRAKSTIIFVLKIKDFKLYFDLDSFMKLFVKLKFLKLNEINLTAYR